MTRRARKGKVGGARAGAGRPELDPDQRRSIKRAVPLTPGEAEAHDEARGEQPWADWIRELADRAIARTR